MTVLNYVVKKYDFLKRKYEVKIWLFLVAFQKMGPNMRPFFAAICISIFLGTIDTAVVLFKWRNKAKKAKEIVICTEQEMIKKDLLPNSEQWLQVMSEDSVYSLLWVAIRWEKSIKMFYFNTIKNEKLRIRGEDNIIRIEL